MLARNSGRVDIGGMIMHVVQRTGRVAPHNGQRMWLRRRPREHTAQTHDCGKKSDDSGAIQAAVTAYQSGNKTADRHARSEPPPPPSEVSVNGVLHRALTACLEDGVIYT